MVDITLFVGVVINPNEKERMLPFIKSNFRKISEREMARRLHVGKTTVNRWRKETGLILEKNSVNENFFKKWNPEMSYILGYIFADGNINWKPQKSYRSLTITSAEKDKEHLEKLRNVLESSKELLYSGDTKSYRLIINNKMLCMDLMSLGLIPRKSLVVRFPKIPQKFLRHFVRGVVDGDGNVRYVKRKRSPYFEITVSSGSKKFLEVMSRTIFLTRGIQCKVRKQNNNVFILQYSCQRGLKLADWIYSNENLHLDRKFQQFNIALNSRGGGQP